MMAPLLAMEPALAGRTERRARAQAVAGMMRAAATEAVRALDAQFGVLEGGPAVWQALLTLASRHGGRPADDFAVLPHS